MAFLPFACAALILPSITPKPKQMDVIGGLYRMSSVVRVSAPKEADGVVRWFEGYLKTAQITTERTSRGTTVRMALKPIGDATPGAYTLDVTDKGVDIAAADPAGLFYGVQTLRQLLPPELERAKPYPLAGTPIPLVHIADAPRFGWRGLHLDVSRHFFPVSFIKKYIDMLAMNKMNMFHWHLLDDGGWRIEIKKYPKLTELGAWRKGNGTNWNQQTLAFAPNDGKTQVYGGFYTQDEVRDVVKYASQRFITIVPEIEMPGHALPAPTGYPEVGCSPAAIAAWQKATGMSYGNVYCAGKEETFEFVNNVLDEVMSLFPSPFIHIGGDEVDKLLWKNCEFCQARMAKEGLKDEGELQSYFIKRVEKHINEKGRRMIGWDEILEGGLAPNATVMSWRGISGGIEAAKSGHDVVMSPGTHCYFDHSYTDLPLETVYSYEPIPEELTPEEGRHVLGAQGNLWTEWMEDSRKVERMAYPRAVALAEVCWSPKEGRSWIEFQGRLRDVYRRLDMADVQFNLPVPVAKLDACLFTDKGTVEFEAPSMDDCVIRYTTNGRAPEANSTLYTGPFSVTDTADIRAALFRGKNGSMPIRVSYVKARTNSGPGANPGLNAFVKYGQFTKIADMEAIAPGKPIGVTAFDSEMLSKGTPGGITWEGYITIPADGIYKFATTSDDGSVLRIGGATVVDNDGLHGAITKVGRVKLTAGTYLFTASFFDGGGARSMKVDVEAPGSSMQPLPWTWLSRS